MKKINDLDFRYKIRIEWRFTLKIKSFTETNQPTPFKYPLKNFRTIFEASDNLT